MFHKIFTDRRNPALAGFGRWIVGPTTALILATTCAEVGTAQAQARKQTPDTYYVVLLQYRGSTAANLTVNDKSKGEILNKRVEPGETVRVRTFATITRQTQSAPEGQIRWKISRIVDQNNEVKPTDDRKPIWCGDADISDNRKKVLVGFEGEVMGRSC